jgi:hypothetical protein
MYLAGLAILMAIAWLHLPYTQDNIQDVNTLFFRQCFHEFYGLHLLDWLIQAAYIPEFLEDRAVMVTEQVNVYRPTALLFGIPTYWLTDLRSGALPFFYLVF